MIPLRYSLSNKCLFLRRSQWPQNPIIIRTQIDNLSEKADSRSHNQRTQQRNIFGDVVPKIGLEVHAQLNIGSKLFSQGKNSKDLPPNSQLDLFDISLPGTLPKLNRDALKSTLLSGLGLNCQIQERIHFDRKNYFYADMPAGYQITQYHSPTAKNGYLEFIVSTYHDSLIKHSQQYDIQKLLYESDRSANEEFNPYLKRSAIKQIQLEQDSAKSLHSIDHETLKARYSLIDYNRCGSALMEIVFEPDLTNQHEASSLIRELIHVLRALGTCDCELQEASLRVDANVSVDSIGGQAIKDQVRVELKNLNSLRSLNRGIASEISRQAIILKQGKKVVQESRTYDSKSGKTVLLREKEDAVDYRYIPEPSIPPINIGTELLIEVKEKLPQSLPCDMRNLLIDEFKIDLLLISDIMDEPGLCEYFVQVMKGQANYDANSTADFLVYAIANLKLIDEPKLFVDLRSGSEFTRSINPENMQNILDMIHQEEINYSTAFEVLKHIVEKGDKSDPRKIVNDFGWYQINDESEIHELCADTITKMKNISKKYAKKGDIKYMRLMLDKLSSLTDNRISVHRARKVLNDLLRPKV